MAGTHREHGEVGGKLAHRQPDEKQLRESSARTLNSWQIFK